MNSEKVAETIRTVAANNGTIKEVARALFPSATEEELDKKTKQISSIASQIRRQIRESKAVKDQNLTEEEIDRRINVVIPKLKAPKRNSGLDNLIDMFNKGEQ